MTISNFKKSRYLILIAVLGLLLLIIWSGFNLWTNKQAVQSVEIIGYVRDIYKADNKWSVIVDRADCRDLAKCEDLSTWPHRFLLPYRVKVEIMSLAQPIDNYFRPTKLQELIINEGAMFQDLPFSLFIKNDRLIKMSEISF